AAAPVRAAIEELPGVLDPAGVAADQVRHHVVLQVRGHGQFAAVEGGVAEAVHARARGDLQGDEVAPRAGDDDPGVDDLAIVPRTVGGSVVGVHRAWSSSIIGGTGSSNGPAGR